MPQFGIFKEQPCIPGWGNNSDIRHDTLAKKKGELMQHNFKLWEQAAGYNFEPQGLLFDKGLRLFVKPADHSFYMTTCMAFCAMAS